MTYSNSETRLRARTRPAPAAHPREPNAIRDANRPLPQFPIRKPSRTQSRAITLAAALLAASSGLSAASFGENYTLDLVAPTIDKWIYPFASNGGGPRPSGSSFGAIGSAGFDDRDAQLFAAFDTSTVPAGRGSANYHILSATFMLTVASGDSFRFDGSYDPVTTYGPTGVAINGDDAGRPVELYGAGYRNGFTSASVEENTPFRPVSAPAEGGRSIYPTDFAMGASIDGASRDVSNNVTAAFDPVPFAIGQIAPADLNPDGTAKEDATIVFTLNLANPDVLRYLQLSLNEGRVSFLATSLHPAAQGGPTVYPTYYTKENLLGGTPGQLDLQVQVVPEPSAVTMALCGFGIFVAGWRGRRVIADTEVAS